MAAFLVAPILPVPSLLAPCHRAAAARSAINLFRDEPRPNYGRASCRGTWTLKALELVRVPRESVRQALDAVIAALRVRDVRALKAAHELAPSTLDAISSSTIDAVLRGQSPLAAALAMLPKFELIQARWRTDENATRSR